MKEIRGLKTMSKVHNKQQTLNDAKPTFLNQFNLPLEQCCKSENPKAELQSTTAGIQIWW